MSTELDGRYRVTTISDYKGPLQKKSDGETEIVDGRTDRLDRAGCRWTSTFTVLNEREVEMVSVADPTEAEANFLLTRPDGSPTRDPVTYRATLRLARKGEQIQMSGQISYGLDMIFITMRKIVDPTIV
ncbi:MAG: hypothetical protein EOM26_00390 [Alphaproteobacteria bacterium]|nr:hypothetical protein [Alphaproteobacteria bacterium]